MEVEKALALAAVCGLTARSLSEKCESMSQSFLTAASRRAADVWASATHSVQPWDELPEPALLALALSLAADWPDENATLAVVFATCRSWWLATMHCDAVWRTVCCQAGLADGTGTRVAYMSRRALSTGGLLDADVNPEQVSYHQHVAADALGEDGGQALHDAPEPAARPFWRFGRKRASSPDTSWLFGERGFGPPYDHVAWFSVHIARMGDEIRVGFTDDRDALLHGNHIGMTYHAPHGWLYSDGRFTRGVHAAGRQHAHARHCPTFGPDDTVTVRLDFARDEVSWFVNLHDGPCHATHAHTMAGLPKGRLLYAAIVLDERDDLVRYEPHVPAAHRRTGEALLRLARRHADAHGAPDFAVAAGVTPFAWAAALAGHFLLQGAGDGERPDEDSPAAGPIAATELRAWARRRTSPCVRRPLRDGELFARFDEFLGTCDVHALFRDWSRACGVPFVYGGGAGGEFLGWADLVDEEDE